MLRFILLQKNTNCRNSSITIYCIQNSGRHSSSAPLCLKTAHRKVEHHPTITVIKLPNKWCRRSATCWKVRRMWKSCRFATLTDAENERPAVTHHQPAEIQKWDTAWSWSPSSCMSPTHPQTPELLLLAAVWQHRSPTSLHEMWKMRGFLSDETVWPKLNPGPTLLQANVTDGEEQHRAESWEQGLHFESSLKLKLKCWIKVWNRSLKLVLRFLFHIKHNFCGKMKVRS